MSEPLAIRIIPVVELRDAYVSEPIEGASSHLYARSTRRHPDPSRRSQVFPHPDLESEEVIQKWLADWPKARFDVFALRRFSAEAGVEFVVQIKNEDGKWVTVKGDGKCGFQVLLNAEKTTGQSAGSCPAQVGSIPTSATLPQTAAAPAHDANYVGECSDGALVGDPIDNLRAAIKAKLAEKNYRAPELAKAIGEPVKRLLKLIQSPRSGFHQTPQGWIKVLEEQEPAAVAA